MKWGNTALSLVDRQGTGGGIGTKCRIRRLKLKSLSGRHLETPLLRAFPDSTPAPEDGGYAGESPGCPLPWLRECPHRCCRRSCKPRPCWAAPARRCETLEDSVSRIPFRRS